MAKLQLRDSALHLDIDDHLFDVAITPQFLEAIQEIGKNAMAVNISGEIGDAKAVGEWMSDSLDKLLGVGAAQEIWGDEPNLPAFGRILSFIMSEAAKLMADPNTQLKQPGNVTAIPMNRAQRRAMKPPQAPKPVSDVEAAKAVLRAEGYEFTD